MSVENFSVSKCGMSLPALHDMIEYRCKQEKAKKGISGEIKATTRAKVALTRKGRRKRDNSYPLRTKLSAASYYGSLMPDEMDVELTYYSTGTLSGATSQLGTSRATNGAWDPDPSLGGTSFTGLAEWANLYAYYRVVSYHYEVEVVNNETYAVNVNVFNTSTVPPGVLGPAEIMQRFTQSHLLPAKGGMDHHTFRKNVNVSTLQGRDVEFDDNFRGLTGSTNPTDLTWWTLVATSIAGANLSNGVSFELRLRAKTRLYDPKVLS